jgi:large subunit ribosomal protein L25
MARKELPVEPRQIAGKKVVQLRRQGLLPANIFGHGLESVSVQLRTDELERTLRAATANEVIDVKVAGETAARPVVVQHVQRHPLTSAAVHADFYQVSLREKMRASVPILIVGESEAVGTYNGVLVHALESLNVEALPLDIPTHIEVDISVLRDIESAVHVRDIAVASNVSVLNDPELVIVKVEASRVAAEEAAIEEAAAEEAVEAAAAEAAAEEAATAEGATEA